MKLECIVENSYSDLSVNWWYFSGCCLLFSWESLCVFCFQVTLGEEMFHVRRLRGEGAYAKVFQASTLDPMNITIMPMADDDEDDDDEKQVR